MESSDQNMRNLKKHISPPLRPRRMAAALLSAALLSAAIMSQAIGGGEDSEPVPADADTAMSAPERLDLNTATADHFRTIPGVGARMVREFFEYRPYISIQQYRREIGKYVDADQVATWEQYLFVPVDPNRADTPTLAQLPGVNAALAERIAAARPFASAGDFVQWLAAEATLDNEDRELVASMLTGLGT